MSEIFLINQYGSTPETGMTNRHHYLAKELAKLGHSVTLVVGRYHHLLREDAKSADLSADEWVDGYRLVRINVPKYKHAHDKRRILAWFVFTMKLTLLKRRLGTKPDAVIYSSPQPIGYLGAEWLARSSGAQLVFEVRDIWPLTLIELGGYSSRHPLIRFLQYIERRAYKRADRVISNLEGSVGHMAKQGMALEKFLWIPNGVDLSEAAAPLPLSPEILDQVPKKGLRIVYSGTIGTANALETIVEAAQLLRGQPDITFLIAGQGRSRGDLEQRCRELKLKNVQFLGVLPKAEVQSLLRECDACIISILDKPLYRFGTSPNKLFDYFCSGRPVISLYSGGYDLVTRFNAGIQVPAEDPAACAEAINHLNNMSEPEVRALGENGRKAIVDELNYEKIAKKLNSILVRN